MTRRTKPATATWLGRPGVAYSVLATSKADGPRVSVHRWTDTDEVVVKAIEGDGRRADEFREYARVELDAPTEAQIDAAVNEMMERLAEVQA